MTRVVAAPLKVINKVPLVGKIAAAAIPGVGPALAFASNVSTVRPLAPPPSSLFPPLVVRSQLVPGCKLREEAFGRRRSRHRKRCQERAVNAVLRKVKHNLPTKNSVAQPITLQLPFTR